MKKTYTAVLVVQRFLAEPGKSWHGYDLMRATGLPSGSLYPILARLSGEGWLDRYRNDDSPRVLYRLTPKGEREGQDFTRRTP